MCPLQVGEEEEVVQDLIKILILLLPHPSYHSTLPPLPQPRSLLSFHCPQALTRNIPHSHGLVQTGGHHQVLRWVELGTHHIVIMAGQHTVDEEEIRSFIQKY